MGQFDPMPGHQAPLDPRARGYIDDAFASTSMTLTYDDTLDIRDPKRPGRKGQAGNLTADGIFKFVYDA